MPDPDYRIEKRDPIKRIALQNSCPDFFGSAHHQMENRSIKEISGLADKQQINLVTGNILGNAIRYTAEGGKIDITIGK
ncbi:MAG: hypothetical protein ACLFQB_12105 [Chitinispirillaceae bacterium]